MSMDGNIGNPGDEDRVLVGEFALGLLDAEAHARMAARIAADPALRRDLKLWQRRLAALDREFVEQEAPRAVLARIEAELFPASRPTGLWNSLAFWRSLA